MISVKGGTQTWSNSPQRTDFKSDGAKNISARDQEKLGGDEPIGDVLNRVADPNYTDPGKKMRTVGNNQLGKDAFMSLLLTQMKNQDPTNPLKSHEMAAQLAQFTSLEKLHNINEAIEGLRKDQQPNHNFQALSFIGKAVSTDNSKITRTDADAHHDVRFSLPQDGQKITVQIKDAGGAVVRTLEYNGMKQGKNEINWNGLLEDGHAAPVGDYVASIEAIGNNGRKLGVEMKTEGVITGVNFTPKGPQLLIGKQIVNVSDVKSISDPDLETEAKPPGPQMMPIKPTAAAEPASEPGLSEAEPATAAGALPALPPPMGGMIPTKPFAPAERKMEVKPEHKANAEKRARLSKGNVNDSALAQGLINKLNKEGAKAGMGGS